MSQQIYVNDAMESNYKLMNDLNTFNMKYAKYVKCNDDNAPQIKGNCSLSDLTCCSTSDIGTTGLGGLTTLKGTLIADINNMREDGNLLTGNLISKSQFQTNHSQIISRANEINTIRSDLDNKMRELYKIDGNLHQDYFLQYDSVMYTGILFSILATTILYYTFTKL
jgi:hypothetical protein